VRRLRTLQNDILTQRTMDETAYCIRRLYVRRLLLRASVETLETVGSVADVAGPLVPPVCMCVAIYDQQFKWRHLASAAGTSLEL